MYRVLMKEEIMKIPPKELDFTFSRSSGAGGQNVNKLNTKVTLTWNFTKSEALSERVKKRFQAKYSRYLTAEGLYKITSQRFRNQSRNIADCINKLEEMIEEVCVEPKRRIKTKPTKGSIAKRISDKKNKGERKQTRKKIKI